MISEIVRRLQIICISLPPRQFPLLKARWAGPSHQIQPCHSLAMHFVLPFMLSLVLLANTTYIPSLTKANTANIATRDVNGYRSVAYFVNWV